MESRGIMGRLGLKKETYVTYIIVQGLHRIVRSKKATTYRFSLLGGGGALHFFGKRAY